jgi:hypothetical protein
MRELKQDQRRVLVAPLGSRQQRPLLPPSVFEDL